MERTYQRIHKAMKLANLSQNQEMLVKATMAEFTYEFVKLQLKKTFGESQVDCTEAIGKEGHKGYATIHSNRSIIQDSLIQDTNS